jgi:hypothetical protein
MRGQLPAEVLELAQNTFAIAIKQDRLYCLDSLVSTQVIGPPAGGDLDQPSPARYPAGHP